jgi:hypothetical protein
MLQVTTGRFSGGTHWNGVSASFPALIKKHILIPKKNLSD